MKISGSLFTENAVEKRLPFLEALGCLLDLCDRVVVFDLGSSDETLSYLKQMSFLEPRLKVVDKMPREKGERDLLIKRHLRHPWHFFLKDAELIDDSSIQKLKSLVRSGKLKEGAYEVQRLVLLDDLNLCVPDHTFHSPFDHWPVRLVSKSVFSQMDAFDLLSNPSQAKASNSYRLSAIMLFYYAELLSPRDRQIHTLSYLSEDRVLERRLVSNGKGFMLREMIEESELSPIPRSHPKRIERWKSDILKHNDPSS